MFGVLDGDDYGAGSPTPTQEELTTPVAEPTWGGGDPTLGGDGLASGSFAHDLLAAMNLPVTPENIRFMNAWQRAEGGGKDGPSKTDYNWLNTTQSAPGAVSINKVGVKKYGDYHTGLMATIKTLVNGRYTDILEALGSGRMTADQIARASSKGLKTWGSGEGVLKVLGG